MGSATSVQNRGRCFMKTGSQRFPGARRPVVAGLIAATGLLLWTTSSARVFAQQTQIAATLTTAEGDWVRTDDTGNGSFGGVGAAVTKAELTPEAIASAPPPPGPRGRAFTENRVHGAGDPYIVTERPCTNGGGGGSGVSPDSSAIHIIAQKEQIVIAREGLGPRYIYMDGRAHPDLSRVIPTITGHSVGHYENGVLVVDTIGLTPGNVAGGGRRTPETHMTERFDVSPDGKHMTITYIWTDPKIYLKPHTYRFTFDRLPPGSYAYDYWCDASDPIEQQSIVPPKQE